MIEFIAKNIKKAKPSSLTSSTEGPPQASVQLETSGGYIRGTSLVVLAIPK